MNTQLVESLVQIIQSLSPEEQKLLETHLAEKNSNWQEVLGKIETNRQEIYASRQGKPFDLSIDEIIEEMREERTQDVLQACFGKWFLGMTNQTSFTICIDSNFIVRLLVGYYEETIYLEMWNKWCNANTKIVAPDLINYEVTNVLWRLNKTNQINYTQAQIALTESFNLGIELYSNSELHQDALAIAEKFQLSAAYDVHYLALAEKMQIDFYTCDKKLFNSVQQNFPRIKLVIANSS